MASGARSVAEVGYPGYTGVQHDPEKEFADHDAGADFSSDGSQEDEGDDKHTEKNGSQANLTLCRPFGPDLAAEEECFGGAGAGNAGAVLATTSPPVQVALQSLCLVGEPVKDERDDAGESVHVFILCSVQVRG